MMKHELEKQLEVLEKKGIDRRHFFRLLAASGLMVSLSTNKAQAFSSNAKGKIVIIGGGAALRCTGINPPAVHPAVHTPS